MSSFLVERYLPGLSESALRAGLERVQAACLELSQTGTQISYRGSIFLPDEESCFCRFDGEGPEAVAEVNHRGQVPFARITPGVDMEPGQSNAPSGDGAVTQRKVR